MNEIDACRSIETERQTRELQALYTLTNTISRSLNLDSCLQTALVTTIEVLKVDAGRFYVFDGKINVLRLAAHWGIPEDQLSGIGDYAPGEGVIGRIFVENRPFVFADVETDLNYQAMARGKLALRGSYRSVAGLPITIKDRPVGVIYLYGKAVREFTPQDIELLSTIGDQIGVAVENARLFQETEQRARQQEALNTIATAISQSLNLKELFKIALDRTVEVTGRKRVNIRLKDSRTGKVSVVAYRGFSEQEIEELGRRTVHPQSAQVFASGNPLVINDQPGDSSAGLLAETQSVAWIPVKAGARVIGVLGISDDQSRPFSPSEVEFLQAIANVIGVAIENARLFDQTKRNLEQIRILHEIGTAIISTLDMQNLLAVFLEKIDRILPYSASSVRLFNPATGLLEPVACRNLDDHEWRAAQWRGGRGMSKAVFESKAPLMVRNLQSNPRLRDAEFFRKQGLVSYLGIPLMVRDEILGVLSFYTREEREFTSQEVEFLSTLAGQGAVGIQNSQLYEQTRRQAVELEKSNEAKDELLNVMARQKEELARLNAGLECEVVERGRARAELAAKNRDLETLLYVTSHDLREPLRAIENFTRMINERYRDRLDDKGQDFLRRVILGSQRLNRLLDDILVLSRSQRMGAPSEEVDGESIVLETIKRLEGKINATGAQIHVAKDFGGLRVDKVWATQAVYNLIANALKFTRDGERPVVEVAPYRSNGPDSGVIGIAVRDRGPGVPPGHAERIFQLFQRAVGREVEGTGAGLAIVRQIAERHGGSAWVEPREGGGSEFIITFSRSDHLEGENNNGNSNLGDPLS